MTEPESNSEGVLPGVESDRPSLSEDLTLWKEGSEVAQAPHDPRIGTVIAERYRIEGLLGEGGMGRVYRAVHVHMHKDVALKVLRPEMMAVPGVVVRFEREAVAAGRISHPNVVAATDFGRIDGDGAFYLVLEYVNGRSLRHELKHGAFTVPRAVRIALQVCEALAAAHQRGVIHRDLKPDNIMLVDSSGSDLVKVLDFGIAKLNDPIVDSDEQHTRMGLVMGTPRYMSPEQGAGAPVDHRTDLYSLGVILYEMLSGQPPFGGGGVDAVLAQHLAAAPPPLPAHVDSDVTRLVFHLLAKEAKARPESAGEVLPRLRRVQRETARPSSSGLALAQNSLARGLQDVGGKTLPVRIWVQSQVHKLWRQLTQHAPWLTVLERKVRLGQFTASWGAIISAVGATLLAALLWGGGNHVTPTPLQQAEPVALNNVAPAPAAVASSPTIEREVLEDLLAIPVYKRDRQQWLTIAAGHAGFSEWRQSVAAYRNALQLEPRLKDDRQLVLRLREMAVLPEVHDAVANIALNLLGEQGMDLMYDVWLATRSDEANAVIAASAQKNLGIFRLRSASRALRVVLALQFAKPDECLEVDKALTDALEYADERAVPELVKLQTTTGCGASKKRDCFACIRPRARELEAALKRAATRRAPRFE